jgi:CBS domain-containing protein
MTSEFDEEMDRMDELEKEVDHELSEAVSLNDPLSSLSLSKPIVLNVGDSLASMIMEMQKKSIGCVLISHDGNLTGIITERDILLKITGKGLNLEKENVENFMTKNPESLKMDDPVAFALNKMYVGGFRHVPITDDSGSAVGLVSVVDIVRHVSAFFSQEVLNLPPNPQRGFDRPEGG